MEMDGNNKLVRNRMMRKWMVRKTKPRKFEKEGDMT